MNESEKIETEFRLSIKWAIGMSLLSCALIACTTVVTGRHSALESPHLWDSQYGNVVPHENFSNRCSLCHDRQNIPALVEDFSFDHEAETGVRLDGSHTKASCLRCHNDRGSVAQFASRGCAGCHVTPHIGSFGNICSDCHDQMSWPIKNVQALHRRTRFPHTGAHTAVSCFRCHEGAQVGNFRGEVASCESCHQAALAAAPSFHITGGLTSDCQRCHKPTIWAAVAP